MRTLDQLLTLGIAAAASLAGLGIGAQTVKQPQISARMLLDAENSGQGGLEVAEFTFPAGTSVGGHLHGSLEVIYVLEGSMEHVVEGRSELLSPGMIGHVERGQRVEHHVRGDEPVRALVLWSPAGEGARLGIPPTRTDPGNVDVASDASVDDERTIGVLVFDGFLTSEVVGPMEVLGKAITFGLLPEQEIVLVSTAGREVRSADGVTLVAEHTIATSPPLDVLIVPSAYDMGPLLRDEALIEFIRRSGSAASIVMGNCSGAFLLGAAGLLDGKRATTWPGGEDALAETAPAAHVVHDTNVVFDSGVLTTNGALVSYSGALRLLEELIGPEDAARVARELYLERLVAGPA